MFVFVFDFVPQTVLALRGSYGVAREGLWFLSGRVHGWFPREFAVKNNES